MSEIRATTISDAAGTGPVTLTKQSAAKAWVNFNGTGTVAIRDSLNVASITDNSTGNYTVNFSNSMSADYSATVTVRNEGGAVSSTLGAGPVTTSSFTMYSWNSSPAVTDVSTACGTTHGDLA